MRRKFSFASHQIRSREDLELFTNHPDGGVIGIFPEEDEDTESFYSRSYHKIVGALADDYRFAHVTDRTLAKELFMNKKYPDGLWNNIILHRPIYFNNPFEDTYKVFEGDKLTAGLIRTFVKDHQTGLCPILTVDQFHATRPPMVMFYYHFHIEKDPKGMRYWRNRIMKVALEFPDFQFGIGNAEDFKDLLDDSLGGKPDWGKKAPKVVIWNEQYDSYRMEVGEVCDEDDVCDMLPDGSNVRQFIQQYQNGELKFYVKSAEPPEENNDPVKIVTGNTFKSIVLDEEKDVFVEFYAPWCGHCKTLEPIWEELAQTLLEDEKILIAKMDATANHPPKYFRYNGFPTIFWAGRGAKDEPEQYKGSRNIEGFLQFIRERVDYQLKLDETKESEENNSYEHTEL